MNVRVDSPNEAREAAQNISARITEKENAIQSAFNELKNIDPELGDFQEIATLLALDENSFSVLAPVFLEELEKAFNNTNAQLAMGRATNVSGIKSEDLREEYKKLCEAIDSDLDLRETLSVQKRDFVKTLIGIVYNAAGEVVGITKRHVQIPIEYCRPDAKMPIYAHLGDAGMDLYAPDDYVIEPGETKIIPTGLKVAIPKGYALLIHPRSGTSLKTKLRICNSIGLIDSGYRNEIGVIVENIDLKIRDIEYEFDESARPVVKSIIHGSPIYIAKGERFAQMRLVEVPKAVFYEVNSVTAIESDGRGEGGYGSTGVK